jgi:hypothetical protein
MRRFTEAEIVEVWERRQAGEAVRTNQGGQESLSVVEISTV